MSRRQHYANGWKQARALGDDSSQAARLDCSSAVSVVIRRCQRQQKLAPSEGKRSRKELPAARQRGVLLCLLDLLVDSSLRPIVHFLEF